MVRAMGANFKGAQRDFVTNQLFKYKTELHKRVHITDAQRSGFNSLRKFCIVKVHPD